MFILADGKIKIKGLSNIKTRAITRSMTQMNMKGGGISPTQILTSGLQAIENTVIGSYHILQGVGQGQGQPSNNQPATNNQQAQAKSQASA